MKIDQLLIYYLLKNREMNLQGIGTFRLEGAVSDTGEKGKPLVIPADAISFEYNPKTKEDDSLVKFISENTGKIHPLASADLDSYLMLGTQFLNIGKPMILPNIGTIEKTDAGQLIFKGGEYTMEHIVPNEVQRPAEEENEPEREESFSDFPAQKRNYGKAVPYVILVVILGLIAWAVWKYAFNHTQEETITQTAPASEADSSITSSAATTDSIGLASSNSALADSSKLSDTVGFKIVVGTYKTLSYVQNRLQDLKANGRNVIMYTTDDSLHFKIAEVFKLPLSDTTKVINSLKPYYGPERKYLVEH